MSDLKTLKDLVWETLSGGRKVASIDDLRQEAIKWIKKFDFLDMNRWELGEEDDKIAQQFMDSESLYYFGQVKDWIKWFFNISEEDLK